jgi:hypothetical protein
MVWGRPLWTLPRRESEGLAWQPEMLPLDHNPPAPAPGKKISQPEAAFLASGSRIARQRKPDGQRVACLFRDRLGLSLWPHGHTPSTSRPLAQPHRDTPRRRFTAGPGSQQPHADSHRGPARRIRGCHRRQRESQPPPHVSHRCSRRVTGSAKAQRIASTCPHNSTGERPIPDAQPTAKRRTPYPVACYTTDARGVRG